MKIEQKIILGFAVIAILFGLAGTLHVASLMKIESKINHLVFSHLEELESAEEVFKVTQNAYSTIQEILVDSKNKPHEGHAGHISQARDSINSSLYEAKASIFFLEKTTLAQITLGDLESEEDELREIQLLKGYVKDFSDLVGKFVALLEAGEYESAQALSFKNILPISLTVQALISDLEVDAQEEIEMALSEARADAQKSIRASTIITVAALIAVIVLGWFMSNSISVSIRKLHEATTQLGKGKLGTRVDVDSNDEVGQIAKDINEMAEGLRKEIVSRDDLASERKNAEEHFRGIIAKARDAFISMDSDGTVTDWNAEAENMFGFAREEMLGRELAETIIPPEFRKKHIAGLKHYLKTGKEKVLNRHVEITAVHKDGHIFPVELSIVPQKLYETITFNAFIRNLTEKNRAINDLRQSEKKVRKGLVGTILAISRIVEARDSYTAGHQQGVARLSRAIAQEMGLDNDQVEGIRTGATIHDIGKIHLPAEILSKPGNLSEMEFELVKSHAQTGYDILKNIEFPWPVADITYQHHERINGTGYPQGLKGDEICLEARIVAVADVVESMSSHRPYRASLGIDAALEEIQAHRGSLYDKEVVDACVTLFNKNKFSL